MQKALEILQNSGVILTPTDTTFGLSCLAFDQKAISKLNQIKQRPNNKSYILLVDNDASLQKYVDVPDLAWDIIDLSEKPVTIVYEKILDLPDFLLSPEGTIAIRVVKYPLLQRLIQRSKQPLISTSANIAGEAAPTNYQQISNQILEQVDYIMPEAENFIPEFPSSSLIQITHDFQVKVLRS